MTTNQTIDGVPRELLERLLTEACNENWSDLNELLHSAGACRCKRYGKGNPHWPCPVHPAPAAQTLGTPVAWKVEVDGMTLHHREPMDHPRAKNTPLYEQPAPVAVNSLAMAELRHIFDSNKGADGTLVISKKLAAQILSPSL